MNLKSAKIFGVAYFRDYPMRHKVWKFNFFFFFYSRSKSFIIVEYLTRVFFSSERESDKIATHDVILAINYIVNKHVNSLVDHFCSYLPIGSRNASYKKANFATGVEHAASRYFRKLPRGNLATSAMSLVQANTFSTTKHIARSQQLTQSFRTSNGK